MGEGLVAVDPEGRILQLNLVARKLFELDSHSAIFTHFMIINAICGMLTESAETVCCVPDNGSIMKLRLDGNALKLVEVGRQMQTKVN